MTTMITTQEFSIPIEHYRTTLRHAYLRQNRRMLWIAFAVPIIIAIWSQGNLSMVLSWWPFVVLVCLGYLILAWWLPSRLARAQYAPNGIGNCSRHVIFESEGVTCIYHNGTTMKRHWGDWWKLEIQSAHVVLWEKNAVNACIVPFAAFQSPDDLENVKMQIADRQKGSKRI